MKVLVIYDSETGNTEKMARDVAEGVASVNGSKVEVLKVGEPFPLTKIAEANGVMFGSPAIYADVSDGMRRFLDKVERYLQAGKMEIKDVRAAVFGSYGYDGAWVMQERFKERIRSLGYKVYDEVCVETDSSIKYDIGGSPKRCREFGKEFAGSLK